MHETATRLMDIAENHIRDAGYAGFSFRELASEIGIRSATVHHHFPTKASMGASIARRYTDRFLEAVAPRPAEKADNVIAIYRDGFRAALEIDGRMCLGGMLGAEAIGLPDEVTYEIKQFFKRCLDDLSTRIGGPGAEIQAHHVMATLEGGMILARALGSIEAFDKATAGLE